MAAKKPTVAIVMGSKTDWPTLEHTVKTLKEFGVVSTVKVMSAHRTPHEATAFAENAAKIGEANPFLAAQSALANLQIAMSRVSLLDPEFPVFENPLLPITQDTPVTPTSLNLPGLDSNIINNPGAAGSFSSLTTAQKLQILFPQG